MSVTSSQPASSMRHEAVSSTSRTTLTGHVRSAPKDEAWHALSVEAAATSLHVDLSIGLAARDAAARLARDGTNVLAEAKERSALSILGHQFKSVMVVLLVIVAGVALLIGEVVEAVAILVVIALNALIGFVTEWKAARSLAGLRRQRVTTARVRRDGAEVQMLADDLVQGDVVLVAAGDRIPADGRIVDGLALEVDEAMLTGESLPVGKTTSPLDDPGAPLADRVNMVHLGTAVTAGRGVFVVTSTGIRTELGKIGKLIDGAGERGTPIEAKLAELGRTLLFVVLVLCVVIVGVGWLRGHDLLVMIEVGVSLAIAAVPEGLLAVTTMTLAVGVQRMARLNALVRRLPAVEALGSATVICTDKTGTLTRNEMTVCTFVVAGRRVHVSGTGYDAVGEFREPPGRRASGHTSAAHGRPVDSEALQLALRIGALCNDARIDRSGSRAVVLGDPTEGALLVAAEKAGLQRARLERDYPRARELPFSSETNRMVTVHTTREGKTLAYVKGSPGAVLAASASVLGVDGVRAMSEAARVDARRTNEELAAAALRVLGLAYRELQSGWTEEDLARDLIFVGLVGMLDPLRDEAKRTVGTCRRAGVRTVMITGDQEGTATVIARELGLDLDASGKPLRTVHGRELADLDATGWQAIVAEAAVFARVSPEHKLKIVEALQAGGQVVAMTGDGVNDAPALRKADVGIAMGIRGTEVAKDAADMIITDDNFATIVAAVEQGRIIVHNIRRFIHYLFSSNLAEIVTVFAAIMIGWPLPLGVLQILWLNLITDIFPAMALALEPSAPDVMKHPPRDPEAALMTPRFGWLIVWQGALIGGCTLAAFATGMRWYGAEGAGLRHAETIAFMTLAVAQIFHAFNARSRTRSALTSRPFTNPWLWGATLTCLLLQVAAVYVPPLRRVLETVPLTSADWALIALCAVAPVAVVELVKLVKRLRRRGRATVDHPE